MMPMRAYVASVLKKALLSGEYKSGDELSLTKISSDFGISRTPVREAFQTLESEGLIELRMNKGAIVKKIDDKFIIDHYEMRILLECDAVSRATKNNMDVSGLLNLLKEMLKNINSFNDSDFQNINQQVHTSIWSNANNQKLYGFLLSMWNGPSTNKSTEFEQHLKSTQEHIDLLTYIQNKDELNAINTMKHHITRSMVDMLDSFHSSL